MVGGVEGKVEESGRPKRSTEQRPEGELCEIVRLKLAHVSWGPRKIRELYLRRHGGGASESTFKRVLERAGLTQKRPKRRFVGARAQEYRFARYVEDWRLKVESIGNRNSPEAARAQKLYGSLLLTLGIRANRRVQTLLFDPTSGPTIPPLPPARLAAL